ncbi:MAG: hypothetical protein RMY36_031595 [Nostoc sp. SerVER01]|nr:hypothetical protein [Nostoc sp. SerVER01]MDZ8025375.1 hypothetical protein [Nostoc sp. DedQUE11]MDZ8075220.1 hypothetical protein [Nostoc sp. DedQUE01]
MKSKFKAIAEIITNPPDIGYWIDTSRIGIKPCAKIRFTSKLVEKPLLREGLKLDPVLKTLMVIRQPTVQPTKLHNRNGSMYMN